MIPRRSSLNPLHKTKYLRLWNTKFLGSKRTSVLVAKETAWPG